MTTHALTADEISALALQVPDLGNHPDGWSYDPTAGELTITDDALAAKAEAIMAVANWDAAVTKQGLIAYASNKRWIVHTGGVVVGGIPVRTDADSKTLIIGMRMRADKDPTVTENFVAGDGSIHVIDATTIVAVSDAVADLVSAAFTTSSSVIAAINAGTVTTTAQIDAAPWPSNS